MLYKLWFGWIFNEMCYDGICDNYCVEYWNLCSGEL